MRNYSIAVAVSSTIQALEAGHEIYTQVAEAMDSVEKEVSSLTGAEKKQWVLEYAAKEIREVLEDIDYWLPKIMHWIDIFKAAYNALKALF
jgi:hypothetical protein